MIKESNLLLHSSELLLHQLRKPCNHLIEFVFYQVCEFSRFDTDYGYPPQVTNQISYFLYAIFLVFCQNPRYNFWNRSFIRCAPEIEKLFESVSRSCGGPKPVDDSMVSGWV